MKHYCYDGPVVIFGRCVDNRWHGETMANSEKKAKSNLIYQYKQQTNRVANAKVELPGGLYSVE